MTKRQWRELEPWIEEQIDILIDETEASYRFISIFLSCEKIRKICNRHSREVQI